MNVPFSVKKGVLAVGRDADLVVMDKDFAVNMVLIDGKLVWQR